MKITFPHMGNTWIGIKALLEGLGLEVVVPPPVSKKTFELGIKHSPEFACMPLKINMGNFIEAMEEGADTIVMAGGWGPCRFGYYAQVEKAILNDLGYDFKMIILEAPDSKVSELLNQVKELGNNVSRWQAIKAVRFAWTKLEYVEKIEKLLEYYLPRVKDKVQLEKICNHTLERLDKAVQKKQLKMIHEDVVKKIKDMELNNEPVIKIALVGEIYTILEPAANNYTARALGYLGVEVKRCLYITNWLNDNLFKGWIKKTDHQNILQAAQPYLKNTVGGHGQETVGSAVQYARENYDGIIQIAPLTCMPEIVAQSILPRVSEDNNIPCMSLYFDEQSGTAGFQTRLEAFVDMIRRKKNLANMSLKEA
jgi:predicted nucleotide-binding protein (sugar kinase/HSP70/actin superfamily)